MYVCKYIKELVKLAFRCFIRIPWEDAQTGFIKHFIVMLLKKVTYTLRYWYVGSKDSVFEERHQLVSHI